MITTPQPYNSNSAQLSIATRMIHMRSAGLFLRVGAILILAAFTASGFYWGSTASASRTAPISQPSAVARDEITAPVSAAGISRVAPLGSGSYFPMFTLPQNPPPSSVSITTYAGDCTTPKTVFNLQDADKTVCAKVTGGQASWRIVWSNSSFISVQNAAFGTGESKFTLTSSARRGDWRVILFEPFGGSVQAVRPFTVIDAQNPVVDVQMDKAEKSNETTGGAQVVYAIQVTNAGPNSAAGVQLVDNVPANTTFVSFSQLEGPVFSCNNPSSGGTGTTVCTISSLSKGDKALFLATYLVDSGVPAGSSITNIANVSNTVSDSNSDNDSSTASVPVTASPCVLTCPSNITQSAASGESGATVTYSTPTTSGDCGQSVLSTPASGSFFSLGTTTVTATTQTGGICTFQVTVQNPGGLAITLNGANPYALECGNSFDDPGANAVNGVGDPVSVDVSGAVDNHTPGTYTLTYTATEGSNSVSTERAVIVSDSEAPVISLNGANPMTVSSGQTFVDPGASANDDCEGAKTVSSSGTVDTNTPGTYTITYTASDSQNHTATATRTVIVEGNATGAPIITIDGGNPLTIECGSNFIDPGATATSGGASVPVTSNGTVDSHTLGSYTITYTACIEDSPGHCDPTRTATAERTVVVQDTTSPIIEILGANPMTVECHTSFADPGAIAHDGCAADFAATASGTVDVNTVGEYIVTYNATDPSGNPADPVERTVRVVDTTGPVVTAPPNVTAYTGAGATSCNATVSDATLGTASATDACEGSVPTSRSGVPSGNIFPIGTTTITYSANDGGNHTGTATQTVTVIDNTPPTITLNGANPIVVECHTSFTDPGATVHDNCTADSAASATSTVDINVPGTYSVTYNGTDEAGNAATAVQRTVTVVDTIKPVKTINGTSSVTVECHTSYSDAGATASDSCDSSVPVTTSGTVDVNTVGSYTLTYNATDDSGNAAVPVTRTVNVVDTTAPTITLNSYTPSMWPPNHKYTTFQLNQFVTGANDSCNTSLGLSNVVIEKVTSDEIENGNGDGNTFNDIVIAANCKSVQLRSEREGGGDGRVYIITFKVTDASGNVGRATVKVVVPHNAGETPVDSGVHYTVNGSCP